MNEQALCITCGRGSEVFAAIRGFDHGQEGGGFHVIGYFWQFDAAFQAAKSAMEDDLSPEAQSDVVYKTDEDGMPLWEWGQPYDCDYWGVCKYPVQ